MRRRPRRAGARLGGDRTLCSTRSRAARRSVIHRLEGPGGAAAALPARRRRVPAAQDASTRRTCPSSRRRWSAATPGGRRPRPSSSTKHVPPPHPDRPRRRRARRGSRSKLAAEAADAFVPDGVWFVPLAAPCAIPSSCVPTIAHDARRRGATLAAHLRDRRAVLVLDGFERLIGAAADVAALAGRCPGLTVLTTSQRAAAGARRAGGPARTPAAAGRRRTVRGPRRRGPPRLHGDGRRPGPGEHDLPAAGRAAPRRRTGRRPDAPAHPRRTRRPPGPPARAAGRRRPRPARPAPVAAGDDRLELRPARRRTSSELFARLARLRRRLHARGGRGRRATPTLDTLAVARRARASSAHDAASAYCDARDDPRVRCRAPRGLGRRGGTAAAASGVFPLRPSRVRQLHQRGGGRHELRARHTRA